MRFADRTEAGERLAAMLARLRREQPLVVGLTRGGVPVAAVIARALEAPLDALVVRKLGAPMQPELGLGAIAEGGGRWLDSHLVAATGTSSDQITAVEAREREVMERRIRRVRAVRSREPLAARTVILVDDGIATGGSVRAAIASVRAERPRRLVLAVSVAAGSSFRSIARLVDDAVCVEVYDDLRAVGAFLRRLLTDLGRGGARVPDRGERESDEPLSRASAARERKSCMSPTA